MAEEVTPVLNDDLSDFRQQLLHLFVLLLVAQLRSVVEQNVAVVGLRQEVL